MTESLPADGPADAGDVAQRSDLFLHLLLRWAGAWIDLIVLALFLLGPDYLLGNERYQATLPIWLGAVVLYFPVGEAFWGRTLGKLLTGMVVVDETGRAPGVLRALLRTLLRVFEVNPLLAGGIPAAIAVAVTKKRQRLGDMVAGTYVVRTKELRRAGIGTMPTN